MNIDYLSLIRQNGLNIRDIPQELLDEEMERINNGVQGEALAHRK